MKDPLKLREFINSVSDDSKRFNANVTCQGALWKTFYLNGTKSKRDLEEFMTDFCDGSKHCGKCSFYDSVSRLVRSL
jgi:hypothetical protein